MELVPAQKLIEIRQLYLDRRYRKCIAVCDELLGAGLHSVHRVFLLFHQALSYESLGLVAHKYSSNKIPFLETAKDTFTLTLQNLPQPYDTDEGGHNATPNSSPVVQMTEVASEAFTLLDVEARGGSRGHTTECSPSVDSLSTCSADSDLDVSYDEEDVDHDTSTHQARLSASLSYNHVLADELVPSPLFSRIKKIATVSPLHTSTATPTPAKRPLPPLPFFKHQPNFINHSGRLVLVPTRNRQTAIQTIINRFENSLPQSPCTPITPRFAFIHDTFGPKIQDEKLGSYLSSISLARYNSCLTAMRTQLLFHLNSVDRNLKEADRVQRERVERKEKDAGCGDATKNRGLGRSTRLGVRMASYWSFDPLRGIESDERRAQGSHGECDVKKRERIEVLRKQHFMVRKERHGWKGEAYYEDLRQRAERELGG